MKYYTLDSVIREALAARHLSIHHYVDFLVWGLQCYRSLHFDVLQEVKSVRLDMNGTRTVTLPPDFVDYVKVGFEQNGKIVLAGVNNNISNIVPDSGAKKSKSSPFSLFRTVANIHGENTGGFYGHVPTDKNEFKVIREKGVMQFTPDVARAQVYLEYISDGMYPSEQTLVHPYAANAVQQYIFWQQKEADRSQGRLEKDRSRSEYFHALHTLKMQNLDLSVTDIARAINRNKQQSIK
jgi:hypothetical protein